MPWSRNNICKMMSKYLQVSLTWNWLSMGGSDGDRDAGRARGCAWWPGPGAQRVVCAFTQGGRQDDEHSCSALPQMPCGTLEMCRSS